MTTEDDFQRALDANPGDWQTRLVFADWLQERNDPRADGYRALGLLRRDIGAHPNWLRDWTRDARWRAKTTEEGNWARVWAMEVRADTLPADWHDLAGAWGVAFANRRAAEDAAALAFAKLPAARCAELLAQGERL